MASLLASVGSAVMSSVAGDAAKDGLGGSTNKLLGGSAPTQSQTQAPQMINTAVPTTPVSTNTGYDPSVYAATSASRSPFSRLLGG